LDICTVAQHWFCCNGYFFAWGRHLFARNLRFFAQRKIYETKRGESMTEQEAFLTFFEEQIRANNLNTLEEIADRVGLSVSTVSRIRSGKMTPGAGAIRQISTAFGKSENEALGRPVQMCAGAEVIQDLILHFDRRLAEREKLLENMREKLDQAQSIVTEKHQQIIRLTAERQETRRWAICCLGGFVLLLLLVICILIYDLTHLDRGWFVEMFGKLMDMSRML